MQVCPQKDLCPWNPARLIQFKRRIMVRSGRKGKRKMTITLINKFGSYTRDARNLDTAKAFITDAIKNDGVYNASVRNENGKVVLVANKKMFGRIEFSLTH